MGTLELDPLRTMFYRALLLQYWRHRLGGPVGPYYEFGVGEGGSLVAYSRALRAFGRVVRVDPAKFPILGFDTFEGLPVPSDRRDVHPNWPVGRFRAGEPEIRRKVEGVLGKKVEKQLTLIRGRFEESLTDELRERLRSLPPAIVTIDCDYYSSTNAVLGWIEPMLKTGTILYFDDVWEFWGDPTRGELGAIREFASISRGRLVQLTELPAPRWGRVYVFLEGHPSASGGVSSEWPDGRRPPP